MSVVIGFVNLSVGHVQYLQGRKTCLVLSGAEIGLDWKVDLLLDHISSPN